MMNLSAVETFGSDDEHQEQCDLTKFQPFLL